MLIVHKLSVSRRVKIDSRAKVRCSPAESVVAHIPHLFEAAIAPQRSRPLFFAGVGSKRRGVWQRLPE